MLALGTRGEDHDVPVGNPVYVPLVYVHGVGEIQVAELAGDLDVADHGPPRDPHQTPVLFGRLDDLAYAVDVRGEGGDDDAPRGRLEDLVEGLPDDPFGRHVAGPLGVGGVAEVGENALLSQRSVTGQVHRRAFDGGQVDLVVPGEDDYPRVGAKRHGDRVRYGVVDVYELEAEAAERGRTPGLHLPEIGPPDAELGELGAHEL